MTSEKVRQAGRVLERLARRELIKPVIPDAPPGFEFPKGDALRRLVAGQLRELLESDEAPAVLEIFRNAKDSVVAGEERIHDMRIEYRMGEEGPFYKMYRWQSSKSAKPKWDWRRTERISPEELMLHAKHPEGFYRSILGFLNDEADKILRQAEKS